MRQSTLQKSAYLYAICEHHAFCDYTMRTQRFDKNTAVSKNTTAKHFSFIFHKTIFHPATNSHVRNVLRWIVFERYEAII